MRNAVWMGLAVVACTADSPETDKATGDTDAAPAEVTRQDVCEDVGRAGCWRLLTCNLTFTDEDLCTSNYVADCCEDEGTCDEVIAADAQALWEACAEDVEDADCDDVQATLPESCAAAGVLDRF